MIDFEARYFLNITRNFFIKDTSKLNREVAIMRSCSDIKNSLTEYLDNELDLNRRNEVDMHINTCAECKEYFEDIKNTINYLSDLTEIEIPTEFKESLHKRLIEINPKRFAKILMKKEKRKARANKNNRRIGESLIFFLHSNRRIVFYSGLICFGVLVVFIGSKEILNLTKFNIDKNQSQNIQLNMKSDTNKRNGQKNLTVLNETNQEKINPINSKSVLPSILPSVLESETSGIPNTPVPTNIVAVTPTPIGVTDITSTSTIGTNTANNVGNTLAVTPQTYSNITTATSAPYITPLDKPVINKATPITIPDIEVTPVPAGSIKKTYIVMNIKAENNDQAIQNMKLLLPDSSSVISETTNNKTTLKQSMVKDNSEINMAGQGLVAIKSPQKLIVRVENSKYNSFVSSIREGGISAITSMASPRYTDMKNILDAYNKDLTNLDIRINEILVSNDEKSKYELNQLKSQRQRIQQNISKIEEDSQYTTVEININQ